MRIAMWSGPRNLSTAMMYSFGARADCAVWDEPFYAPYLKHSDKVHPMQDEIFAREETDPFTVAQRCIGPVPDSKPVFYQKHMPHHMLPEFPLDWLGQVCNVFLIRHPARVIESYNKKNGAPTLDDIGLKAQAMLFSRIVSESASTPIVVDSSDIRLNPPMMLEKLCAAIGIPWDPAMLSWPEGGHPSDGAWASHWYPEVWKSTGFAPAEPPLPTLPAELQSVLEEAIPYYEQLACHKIKP
ncbi:sulfotransferase-like domain-containing protein [Alteromonas lipolytica]|uniref:Branched-chain amino acid aminotransferase n=1 Tax=Alteromonas lipolytica TaxID=1856405 RepID=A0A1E8FK30_9ALTE|nr:sulfotransferase family protein [Alteromonas lipolytica]OFI35793.1 branched-chain amino acid aminotransferase [Alteromonas lipolytica]GGF80856.1 branched chain amino acid aminotransferase [Alteromonas lipolytica]